MGSSYDPQVTLRMSAEIKAAAGRVMARKGITNLSDFIRQAVVAEIARLEREEAAASITPEQVALAKKFLESQVKPVAPLAAGQLGALSDLPLASEGPQASYDAGAVPLANKLQAAKILADKLMPDGSTTPPTGTKPRAK